MSDLSESRYLQLADRAFRKIQDALEPIDPDDVDYESTGDVLKLTFANGVVCVINTQRPARQVWVAAKSRAWHFSWDEAGERWIDDKDASNELFALLRQIVKENAGQELKLA